MIAVNPFGAKTVGVLGLGRTGLAAARALEAGGAHVVVWALPQVLEPSLQQLLLG